VACFSLLLEQRHIITLHSTPLFFAGAFLIWEQSDRILCHIPLHRPSCAANLSKAVIQKQVSITVFLVAYSPKKYTESNFAGFKGREKTA
jgi:hypothetical protein